MRKGIVSVSLAAVFLFATSVLAQQENLSEMGKEIDGRIISAIASNSCPNLSSYKPQLTLKYIRGTIFKKQDVWFSEIRQTAVRKNPKIWEVSLVSMKKNKARKLEIMHDGGQRNIIIYSNGNVSCQDIVNEIFVQ